MKTKKLNKLVLTKSTIVNLDADTMNHVKGMSLVCPTPATGISWCDCISVELECTSSEVPKCN